MIQKVFSLVARYDIQAGRTAASQRGSFFLQESHPRILIMRRKIQILGKVKIVNRRRKAHHIVGNPLSWSLFTQNLRLKMLEVHDQIRMKSSPVQHLRRIMPGNRKLGCVNLREALILLTPECCSPGSVQLLDTAVLLLQPLSEGSFAMLAHTQIPMTVSQFIICLPSDHVRIGAEMSCKSGHIPPDMLPVYGIGLAIMMPPTKMSSPSFRIHRLYLRIFLYNPGRRRRRRRTQDTSDPMPCQKFDGLIQPLKRKSSFFRF